MRFLMTFPLLFTLFVSTGIQAFASADYSQQVSTIIKFYEVLNEGSPPTVADFYTIFGKDNEAELELILRQEFPRVDWKGNWDENNEALDYVRKVDTNPKLYSSRFLQCLKDMEPAIFEPKIKRVIEIPPRIIEDPDKRRYFTEFTVLTRGEKIVFQFLPESKTIENIYLPNGKSVYSLLEKCSGAHQE